MVLGLSACQGFLDTVPTDSVPASKAMATIEDATVACNGFYTKLKYYTLYGTYIPYMGDVRADNIYAKEAGGTASSIYTWDYDSTQNTYFSTFWSNYYNIIMRTNTFLQNIDALEVSSSKESLKEDLIGQAYAVRALCYFDLARLYGQPYTYDSGASLGAVLIETPVSPSEARLPRSTVAQTYAQVFSDLDLAKKYLSKDKNYGHFNYWGALLLEARAYLYTGKYSEAYTAAKEVIDDSPYEMVERDEYLAHWGLEGNTESVLELMVSIQGDIDDDGGFYTMYHNLWFDDNNAGATLIPTLKWRKLFDDTPNDIRAQWIQDPNSAAKKGEYWLKKFIGNKTQGYTFRRNNPRVMRITEAYLIAAEGALESGKQSEANNYLNAVRKRADNTATDVVATLDLIQTERQKEFIGEGHRFFDVMRRGGEFVRDASDPHEFGAKSQYLNSLKVGDTQVCLPISHTERLRYPELQQNPGYKD